MNFKRNLKRPLVRHSNKVVADLLAVARFPTHGTKPHNSHNSNSSRNSNKPLTIPLAISSHSSPTSSSFSSSTR